MLASGRVGRQARRNIHQAYGEPGHGHKGNFEGKMPHALPSEDTLRKTIRPILKRAGKLPHGSLDTMTTTRKKQTTRLLKAECVCGYTVRGTSKWFALGLPFCGVCNERMVCEEFEDEGEGEE